MVKLYLVTCTCNTRAEKRPVAMPGGTAPALGYPEKFHLALRYGEEGGLDEQLSADVSDSDRLLLYALSRQAQHGTCQEPRPSMWYELTAP